jgi:uncharacterized integral membrane protein
VRGNDKQDGVADERGTSPRIVLLGILSVILAVFVFTNFDEVPVELFGATVKIRLAFALLASAAIGFLAGWLANRLKD